MKSILTKLVLVVSVIATSQAAIASDFEVDGIGYDIVSAADLTCSLTDGKNADGDIIIPEKVSYKGKELTVISIGESAFYESKITSVIIPNLVTKIGEAAFSHCSSLVSVSIPSSVHAIDHRTFIGCSSLTSINIPNSVTSIGDYAFNGCSENMHVVIPNSVGRIGKCAFSSIKEMTLADGNKEIGVLSSCCPGSLARNAFANRPFNTTQLYVGRNLQFYTDGDEYLSPFTDKLEKLIVGGETTKLGEVLGWDYAKYAYQPSDNSRPQLGTYSCHLKYLEIQKGAGTLTLNFNIESTEELEVIINRATDSEQYNKMRPNILRFGDDAHGHFGSIIDSSRLKNVTFGKSMFSLPYNCLEGYNITTIYMRNPQPPTYTGYIRPTTYTDATLYIPKGALEAYQTAEPWKTFWDIQEIDMDSGLDDITLNTNKAKPDVCVDGNLIRILNAEDMSVSVYNPDGSQIWQTDSYTGDAIELQPGMHIVRVGNRAIKLAI